MSHIREIEKAVSNVFQAGKLCFKKWRDAIWSGTAVLRIKVKVAAVPLGINVHDIAEILVFWRRLDAVRL